MLGSPFEGHVISEPLVVAGQQPGQLLKEAVAAGLVVPEPSLLAPSSPKSSGSLTRSLARRWPPRSTPRIGRLFTPSLLVLSSFGIRTSRRGSDRVPRRGRRIGGHPPGSRSMPRVGVVLLATVHFARYLAGRPPLCGDRGAWSSAAVRTDLSALSTDSRLPGYRATSEPTRCARREEWLSPRSTSPAAVEDWPSVGAAAAALYYVLTPWPNQPYPAVDHELIRRSSAKDALRSMPEVDSP